MGVDVFNFNSVSVKRLQVGPLDVNCYVVSEQTGGESSNEAVVIDPGGDASLIESVLSENGLELKYIINTHGHFDHIGGNGELKERTGALVAMHAADRPLLESALDQSAFYGVKISVQPAPDINLTHGAELIFGDIVLKIIHTPGHSEGGVCLYIEDEGILFTGDTLFAGSVGRTDLQGGSYDTLISSIHGKLVPLGDHVRVFPGHGPDSTIADEKVSNPFVAAG